MCSESRRLPNLGINQSEVVMPTAHSGYRSRLLRSFVSSCILLGAAGCAPLPYVLADMKEKIVAIDVALEPDATLVDRTRTPESRITLVRGFIRTSDVHSVSAAVANVLATTDFAEMKLRASGYQSGTWNGTSGVALVVDVSPALRRLEERIVGAVRPFTLNPETAEDFIVTPDGSAMRGHAIDVTRHFIPESSGVSYRAHVFTSSMQSDDAKRAQAQPFEAFTFAATGASIYQLGAQGTPQRQLWTWTGEAGAR